MLSLENTNQSFTYPLTESLIIHSPIELRTDEVAEFKRDAVNRNFLREDQVVIWNHWALCVIKKTISKL